MGNVDVVIPGIQAGQEITDGHKQTDGTDHCPIQYISDSYPQQ